MAVEPQPGPAPIPDRLLVLGLAATFLVSAGAQIALPLDAFGLSRPGEATRHLLGVVGSLLMLVGLTYPLVKRTRLSFLKMHWNAIHMVLGLGGLAAVSIHGAGYYRDPPMLLWLAAVGVVVFGAYGRLLAGRFTHARFASNPYAFLPARAGETAAIRAIVREKEALLPLFEPGGVEAVFTLAPHHWVRRPFHAARYAGLVWRENRLVRAHADRERGAHDVVQRWWRALHLVLASLLLVGLAAHVVTVTFFAGYAAGAGEIYWWHLRR